MQKTHIAVRNLVQAHAAGRHSEVCKRNSDYINEETGPCSAHVVVRQGVHGPSAHHSSARKLSSVHVTAPELQP